MECVETKDVVGDVCDAYGGGMIDGGCINLGGGALEDGAGIESTNSMFSVCPLHGLGTRHC